MGQETRSASYALSVCGLLVLEALQFSSPCRLIFAYIRRVESNKEPLQEASRAEMNKALEQVLGEPQLDAVIAAGCSTNPFLDHRQSQSPYSDRMQQRKAPLRLASSTHTSPARLESDHDLR